MEGLPAEAVSRLLARARADWLRYISRLAERKAACSCSEARMVRQVKACRYPEGAWRAFAKGFRRRLVRRDLALMARALGDGDDMGAAYHEALRYLGLAPIEQPHSTVSGLSERCRPTATESWPRRSGGGRIRYAHALGAGPGAPTWPAAASLAGRKASTSTPPARSGERQRQRPSPRSTASGPCLSWGYGGYA